MKKYDGSMMAYLNEQTKAVATEKTNDVKIASIDLRLLIPNRKNFYGIRDVEKLAKSIALSGHIEPLLVVKNVEGGTYRIISGERRYRAMSLRFEKGEIKNPKIPCIVQDAFMADDRLTAEMRENVALVCANSYRDKTALEKLEEINILEPVAKIYYDEAVHQENFSGAFRTFFAEQFLGISESRLQRILSLRKLTPTAVEALQEGTISDTLAATLSSMDTAAQDDYLARVRNGDAQGTVQELTAQKQSQKKRQTDLGEDSVIKEEGNPQEKQGVIPSASEMRESVSGEEITAADDAEPSYEEKLEKEGQERLFKPTDETVLQKPYEEKAAASIDPNNAEREANSWLVKSLQDLVAMASGNAQDARANGDNRLAAQWELRLAAVNLVIETIR